MVPYVVGDVAKSSSLCIWEGEGGRARRSFHTGLCVFQVFWVLLRGGCVCVCVCVMGGGGDGVHIHTVSRARAPQQHQGVLLKWLTNFHRL